MILGFKHKYTDRTATNFKEKILAGVTRLQGEFKAFSPKIHSLREDPNDRWQTGNSIQMAYCVRSRQYQQFNTDIPELATCKSTQTVRMSKDFALEIWVDEQYLSIDQIDQLIKNDGLSRYQFMQWFFPKDKTEWSGKIIHWTDFKY